MKISEKNRTAIVLRLKRKTQNITLLFLIVFSIFSFQFSIAQNVGVGVADPQEKLDVDGDIQLSDTLIYKDLGKLYIKNDSIFMINPSGDVYPVNLGPCNNCTVSDHASLTTGLISYWDFDANANDAHGSNNAATISGAALTSTDFGILDECYYFDGSNDYIKVNSDASLTNDYLSYSIWVYRNAENGTYQKYFCKNVYSGGDQGQFTLYVNPSNLLYAHIKTVAANRNLSYGRYFKNYEWYHYVVTYDGTNYKLYINGVLESSAIYAASTVHNTIPHPIGFGVSLNSGGSPDGSYFKGWLDEIGIWSRALTASEVKDLYNVGAALPYD